MVKYIPLCEEIAKKGNSYAIDLLGYYYRYVDYSSENLIKAFNLYKGASTNKKQEDVSAIYNYGYMLFYGLGSDKDEESAILLLTEAAEKGQSQAKMFIADLYFTGKVFPQDMEKARKLYAEANL